jgi:hypothetical protein
MPGASSEAPMPSTALGQSSAHECYSIGFKLFPVCLQTPASPLKSNPRPLNRDPVFRKCVCQKEAARSWAAFVFHPS